MSKYIFIIIAIIGFVQSFISWAICCRFNVDPYKLSIDTVLICISPFLIMILILYYLIKQKI